jgi:hypothetical protein
MCGGHRSQDDRQKSGERQTERIDAFRFGNGRFKEEFYVSLRHSRVFVAGLSY